ncbi:MAG: SRPBCC family protein [Acidimicrobiaceae bacterium]|nr:SRPBCC family protein [Acidimicrobiaceae bacterium]
MDEATSSALTPSDEALVGQYAGDGYEMMEPIIGRVAVAAPPADVWAAISPVGNLTSIHPFCERNEVNVWDGARSRDHVYYYSGVHYQREFCDWFDGTGYDLVLGPPDSRTALVRWRIAEADHGSDFSIKVVALLRDDVPAAEREHYAEHMIRRPLPSYLDSVVRGTGHFAETGTPVTKNQFGTHPIYSPAD